MSTVRAKFKVDFVTKSTETATVSLSPVFGNSEENKKFFKYTPGGKIEMQVVNHETADKFTPGKEFYVDFTEA
jgi:hypothetical protein